MKTTNHVETPPVPEDAAQAEWDAFISYAHSDLEQAVRIQAFLEDFALPGRRRKLRIFRDKTDLTGGELRRSLPSEIRSARVLLLCCSVAAARSNWVALEIAEFDTAHGEHGTIVPLLLSGQPADVLPAALAGRDTLVLDLREGWRLGRPRNATRVELLRALATVANIGLRELIPWDALRRRRRRLTVTGLALVGLAAVGIAGAEAWLTQRESNAAALRRDAESASLKLDAGDIPGGVAALGHALARDSRGLLAGRVDVLRHWLAVLPPVRDTANTGGPLVRVNRQTYLRLARDHFAPLMVRDPYIAVSDRHDGIVTASPREIAYFSARNADALARIELPASSRTASIRASRDGRALAVLTTMTRVTNDEDSPLVTVPCTALFVDAGETLAAGDKPVVLQIETTQSPPRVLQMQRAGTHTLFWHDCTQATIEATFDTPRPDAAPDASVSAPEAAAPASALPSATARVALDVPRLPSGVDIVQVASSAWDDTMNAAWQTVDAIAVTKLPIVGSERALWRDFGEERSDPVQQRVGLVSTMDDAAFNALGTSEVEGNAGIADESLALGGFSDGKQRIYWGSYVSGNSYVSVARCVAPAAGKVTACASKFEYIGLEASSAASADGRRYAVSSQHAAAPPLIVYDLTTDAAREPDKEPLAPVATIAFTADSSRLAVLTSVGEVSSYRFDADGTPRFERAIGTNYGEGEQCRNQYALRAMRGALILAVTPDCALQLIDLSTGVLLWRIVLDNSLPGASRQSAHLPQNTDERASGTRADIAVSADGERLLVYAGEHAMLVQASSGLRLSAPFDPRTLVPREARDTRTAGEPAEADSTTSPSDAGQIPQLVHDGTLDIMAGGRAYRRASPPERDAARALLPSLDQRTLLGTRDGRTPLDGMP